MVVKDLLVGGGHAQLGVWDQAGDDGGGGGKVGPGSGNVEERGGVVGEVADWGVVEMVRYEGEGGGCAENDGHEDAVRGVVDLSKGSLDGGGGGIEFGEGGNGVERMGEVGSGEDASAHETKDLCETDGWGEEVRGGGNDAWSVGHFEDWLLDEKGLLVMLFVVVVVGRDVIEKISFALCDEMEKVITMRDSVTYMSTFLVRLPTGLGRFYCFP